jgi:hypothetical protein
VRFDPIGPEGDGAGAGLPVGERPGAGDGPVRFDPIGPEGDGDGAGLVRFDPSGTVCARASPPMANDDTIGLTNPLPMINLRTKVRLL